MPKPSVAVLFVTLAVTVSCFQLGEDPEIGTETALNFIVANIKEDGEFNENPEESSQSLIDYVQNQLIELFTGKGKTHKVMLSGSGQGEMSMEITMDNHSAVEMSSSGKANGGMKAGWGGMGSKWFSWFAGGHNSTFNVKMPNGTFNIDGHKHCSGKFNVRKVHRNEAKRAIQQLESRYRHHHWMVTMVDYEIAGSKAMEAAGCMCHFKREMTGKAMVFTNKHGGCVKGGFKMNDHFMTKWGNHTFVHSAKTMGHSMTEMKWEMH